VRGVANKILRTQHQDMGESIRYHR